MALVADAPRTKTADLNRKPFVPPHLRLDPAGDPVGHVGLGRVLIEAVAPKIYSQGGIELPQVSTTWGNSYWGIVIGCGHFTITHIAVPLVKDNEELNAVIAQFPLPTGTLVEHSDGSAKDKPDKSCLTVTTSHLIRWWLPDEPWPKAYAHFKRK